MDFFMKYIKPLLVQINAIDYEELTGSSKTFSSVRVIIDDVIPVTKGLENNPDLWSKLEEEIVDDSRRFLTDFLEAVREMESYGYHGNFDNDGQEKHGIISKVRECYAFGNQNLLWRMREVIPKPPNQQQDEVRELKMQVATEKTEKEALRKEKQELAASKGVSRFTDAFGREAESNKEAADGWLTWAKVVGGIIAFLLVVGVLFVLYLWWCKISIDTPIFLHLTLAKVLLVSFFLMVFYQAVRNYNRNMHLYTLNRHRKNSIDSFEVFFKATMDSKARDAILMQATKAIFEAGDTGYVSSSKGGGSMSVVENIKVAGQTKETKE